MTTETPNYTYLVDLASLRWCDSTGLTMMFGQHQLFEQFCQVLLDYSMHPYQGYNYTILTQWVDDTLADYGLPDINDMVHTPVNHRLVQTLQAGICDMFNQFISQNHSYVAGWLLPLIILTKDQIVVYQLGMSSMARVVCI